MLATLGFSFHGRMHSGLDDARNIRRIAERMVADGCVLAVNDGVDPNLARIAAAAGKPHTSPGAQPLVAPLPPPPLANPNLVDPAAPPPAFPPPILHGAEGDCVAPGGAGEPPGDSAEQRLVRVRQAEVTARAGQVRHLLHRGVP